MTAGPDSRLAGLFCPSPNFEPRKGGLEPDLLLLHYTGMDSAEGALHWLTAPDSKVSSHYLVDEEGRVTQMVAEGMRAWHAGQSQWGGADDINSCSIGIEIHNPGHELGYTDFPKVQMDSVEGLCTDIVKRHGIAPERVLAHSDVAPGRKIDPGEKFDWRRLSRAGIGLWVEPAPVGDDAGFGPGDDGSGVGALQKKLWQLGYGIEINDRYDDRMRAVVFAFQQHWRQERVDGRADTSTLKTLDRLLDALPRTV